ncbi:hypothetical protein ACJIZ3_002386 [Penstemon smallii]|uniref:Uncharacterized protein n=1 Tax=Penstemon smallii TaxID=265156 RepID=A0ABD3UA11_9LAMI
MGKIIIVCLLVTFLPLFQNQPDFDYYSLVLQWPNSFCRLNPNTCKINSVPLDLTIQGLWPNNFTDDHLEFCRDLPAFNYTIVEGPLKEDLKKHWPDLASADPYSLSFVEYQWRKHGLCVYPTLNQNAYLWKALSLKKYFDVTGTFLEERIIPDDYEMVEVADISKATAIAIGAEDDYDVLTEPVSVEKRM